MFTRGMYRKGVCWARAALELLQRVVVCCGRCWVGSRDLEEREELRPPGTWECCSSGPRDWGGTGWRCELEKLCGSLLFSWLSLGELPHTVLNVLFRLKTKPNQKPGSWDQAVTSESRRERWQSGRDGRIWWWNVHPLVRDILSPGEEQLLCGEPDCMQWFLTKIAETMKQIWVCIWGCFFVAVKMRLSSMLIQEAIMWISCLRYNLCRNSSVNTFK